ncbi:MAG: hypothetical protein WAO00_03490 [Chthoniobacterales bacterium]
MKKLIPAVVIAAVLLFEGTNRVEAVAPGVAEENLAKASMFALGGMGVAGTMSQGERALRELLEKPDAVAQLERLLTSATPAGRLYALLGLRVKDRAAYQRALEKYSANDSKVETARGCMLSQDPFVDLLKEIERGQYDSFLDRKWPPQTR